MKARTYVRDGSIWGKYCQRVPCVEVLDEEGIHFDDILHRVVVARIQAGEDARRLRLMLEEVPREEGAGLEVGTSVE